MKSKKEILQEFKKRYGATKSGLSNQYREAEECMAFYAGDYMNYIDKYNFADGTIGTRNRVKEVQFNRVKPYVDSVAGFLTQIRGKPEYNAVIEDSQQQRMYSEYLNGVSDYIRYNANAPQKESRQDKDMLICGYGAIDTAVTVKDGNPTRDPNGEIIIERLHPLDVGWDPTARETNLLDAKWVYRAKDYLVEEAEDLFDAEHDDFTPVEPETGAYQFLPNGGIQDKIAYEYSDSKMEMVRVYFYQWFDVEAYYRIENPVYSATDQQAAINLFQALSLIEQNEEDELFKFNPEAEMLTITKDLRSDVKSVFDAFKIPFKPVKLKRKVYYTAIISGEKVFDAFKSTSQQGYSIQFKTGNFDDVNKRWFGMVTSMKEPQRFYNSALTKLMLVIAYNSKGGVLLEEGAVDDIQEFERRYSKTDGVVIVNSGALSQGKVQPKAQPQLTTGYEDIIGLSGNALQQTTGIDESFFGASAGGNETALLQRQKIRQASTILAQYVDSVQLYQKEQARLIMSYIRLLAELNNGMPFPVYTEGGEMVIEALRSDFITDEYDIRVNDAPDTPSQQDYYTNILVQIANNMMQVGDPAYKQMYIAALKYLPLPDKDKKQIREALDGDAPIDPRIVQQLQSQVQQLTSQQATVEIAEKVADIEKTKAEVQEIISDIRKKEAETNKTREETEQRAIENDLAMLQQPEVNVNI